MENEEKLDELLKAFITAVEFTWSVDEIKAEHKKMTEGIYVSHSAKICCLFYDRAKVIMEVS